MSSRARMRLSAVGEPPDLPAVGRSPAWPGLRITFSGLLCAGVVVLVGLAALNSETNLLLLLFGIGVGVLLFNALVPVRMVRKVGVRRIVPEGVVAGRPFRVIYVVRSHRRWSRSWSVLVGEVPALGRAGSFPEAYVPVLAAGEQRRIEMVGRCPHRGRVGLTAIRVTSRFPFGLFSCTVRIDAPAEMIVYPPVGRFRRDPWRDHRGFESASSRQRRYERGHDEFYGLREYRQGDNPRWIHWRRSAHAGQLVVREMMPPRPMQLIVLLDPWPAAWVSRTGKGKGPRAAHRQVDADAERVISAAATAVCEGLERGHRVGLICRAAVPVVLAPAGGRSHRQRLLHELALVAPEDQPSLDRLVSRVRWSAGWQAQCVLCVPRRDATHERVLRFLGRRAEGVLVLSPESEAFEALIDAYPERPSSGRAR